MKGYIAASSLPAKRRWKGHAVAVLALVFFSLLVPLAFLLGLHNRFPSGYLSDEHSSSESVFENYAGVVAGQEQNQSEGAESRVHDLIDRFKSAIPKVTRCIGHDNLLGYSSSSHRQRQVLLQHSRMGSILRHRRMQPALLHSCLWPVLFHPCLWPVLLHPSLRPSSSGQHDPPIFDEEGDDLYIQDDSGRVRPTRGPTVYRDVW